MRTAAGEPMPDGDARRARRRDPGADLRRGSAARLPAQRRPADGGDVPGRRARRGGGRSRQRGQPLLRPAAGQADREGRHAGRGAHAPARGARPLPPGGRRDQPRVTCARRSPRPRSCRARVSTRLLDQRDGAVAGDRGRSTAGRRPPCRIIPGRLGYWHVGVPPSGPMDALSFRLANRLVGNPPTAAGLECTLTGPTLRFRSAAVVALTGADMGATLNGAPLDRFRAGAGVRGRRHRAGAGARHRAAAPTSPCAAASTSPTYLGSRATFTLGLLRRPQRPRAADGRRPARRRAAAAPARRPSMSERADPAPHARAGRSRVLVGPHARAGLLHRGGHAEAVLGRLEGPPQLEPHGRAAASGPKPRWARPTAARRACTRRTFTTTPTRSGRIDFTGDMPIILGPDGPSLGGFVCPATIIEARAVEDGPAQGRRHRAVRAGLARWRRAARAAIQEREIDSLRAESAYRAARRRRRRRSPDPARPRDAAAEAARRSSSARTATPTSWSSTARRCWTWRCASGSTR